METFGLDQKSTSIISGQFEDVAVHFTEFTSSLIVYSDVVLLREMIIIVAEVISKLRIN